MSMFSPEIVHRILDALEPVAVLKKINYRTETIQARDDQVRAFCPIHNEAVFRTLVIQNDTKQYRCSYTMCAGARGGDLIDLFALTKKISYDEALRDLADAFHFSVELPTMGDFVKLKLVEGRNYLEMEAHAEALETFTQILRADPENLEANQGLLQALMLAGKEEDARNQQLKIGQLAEKQGDWQLAQETYESYLDEDPDDEDVRKRLMDLYKAHELFDQLAGQYMALAEKYESEDDIDEALKMYRAVEEFGSAIIDVFPHILRLLRESGRRSEAVAECLKRAASLESEGFADSALELLAEALEIDPERRDIRLKTIAGAAAGIISSDLAARVFEWVDGFFERKLYAEALEALEILKPRLKRDERVENRMLQALQAQGKHAGVEELLGRIIDEWMAAGDLNGAQSRLESLLQDYPESMDLGWRKARLHVELKQLDQACEAYRGIIDTLRAEHEYRKALDVYREALNCRPDDLALREEYRQTLIQVGESQEAQAVCLDLAERYLEVNRGEEALERLNEAVQYSPDDMELRLKLAKAAERLGKTDVAVSARMKAAERKIAEGEFSAAVALLEAALKQDMQNTEILDHLATCQQQLGDTVRACRNLEELAGILEQREEWAQCESVLRRQIQFDPTHMPSRERLAAILGQRGRTDEELAVLQETARGYVAESSYSRAEEVCKRILERRPNQVDALEMLIQISEAAHKRQAAQELHRRLAEVYQSLDDRANERKTYERILEGWPDDDEIRRKYVLLLWDQQDLQRMRNEARRLVEIFLRLRRFDEAAEFLAHLKRIAPAEVLFHELAVDLYEQWGKSKEWEESVQALVDLYRRRNLPSEAAEWIARLVERNPGDESLRAEYIQLLMKDEKTALASEQYAILARLHHEHGALTDAIAAYQSALDLNPSNEEVMMALVRLYMQQKNDAESLRLIRALSGLHEHRDEYVEAIAVLRIAFEIDRESIEIRQKIIEILLARKATDEALAELENLRSIHEQNEDWDAAAQVLQQKIELVNDDPALREDLIDLLRRRGKLQERIEEELSLAELFLNRKEPAKAIAILERLVEEDSSFLPARRMRAEAYAANGEEKKALAEFMFISARLQDLRPADAAVIPVQQSIKLSVVKDYLFENFIIGPRNNFAYATSLAVAREPGQTYNPLFLYSDVGLGKTHLLHAIANQILKSRPELRLLYTSADEFISELVEAIETNSIKQFRARYKSTDILLLDDVQFLAGKERAQEEFFHIFNTLFQSQRQIVVTSDRPPKEMAHLEKRLLSRFGAGIIVDIQSPDVETRVAILQREIKQLGSADLPESLAVRLAQRLESNVRELKGAFNQIIAISRLRGEQVSDQDLDEVIEQVLQKIVA